MNPWDLDATGLMIWGLVAHLIADWPLQNDWMANNKALPWPGWVALDGGGRAPHRWLRHPAAYVHAGIHAVFLALVFGWVAVPLALAHMVIDCRWPVARWSQLVRQTQPAGKWAEVVEQNLLGKHYRPAYDVGLEVRFWTDQVFHIACIAVAALVVGNV